MLYLDRSDQLVFFDLRVDGVLQHVGLPLLSTIHNYLVVDRDLCIHELDLIVVRVVAVIEVDQVLIGLSVEVQHELLKLLIVVNHSLDAKLLVIQDEWECRHVS